MEDNGVSLSRVATKLLTRIVRLPEPQLLKSALPQILRTLDSVRAWLMRWPSPCGETPCHGCSMAGLLALLQGVLLDRSTGLGHSTQCSQDLVTLLLELADMEAGFSKLQDGGGGSVSGPDTRPPKEGASSDFWDRY